MSELLADPVPGGTVARIRSLLPSLGPGEQRVAEECARVPSEVALLSVADLAARTGTSAATVVRACQKLGFRGFQHLRLLLLRDARPPAPAVSPQDTAGRIAALFQSAADELRESHVSLDVDAFERAASAVASAPRVLVVGNGASGPSAQLVALLMLTRGRSCEAPTDAVTQQLVARLLRPVDVCLAISDSGQNPVTLEAVRNAATAGATIIGVTSYARSRLATFSTHTLVAGAVFHSWGDSNGVNLAQLLALSALQTAVGDRIDEDREAARVTHETILGIVDDVED